VPLPAASLPPVARLPIWLSFGLVNDAQAFQASPAHPAPAIVLAPSACGCRRPRSVSWATLAGRVPGAIA
jgi:hypothetical protein